jgi:hypothetical protein
MRYDVRRIDNSMEKLLFENPEVAKHVLEVFLSTNGQMNECIEAVAKKASPEEHIAFKRAVGRIVFEVFDKINRAGLQATSIVEAF